MVVRFWGRFELGVVLAVLLILKQAAVTEDFEDSPHKQRKCKVQQPFDTCEYMAN